MQKAPMVLVVILINLLLSIQCPAVAKDNALENSYSTPKLCPSKLKKFFAIALLLSDGNYSMSKGMHNLRRPSKK
ncbi:hypothetical protein [Candidatus Finniella inopinata]|uniref:Uncharacterized protein n=1 Tax=Candidatus Finniella inopinata TaxID=1696036 RepID=A0A4Q7DIF0_9PROT|nr:hypothetical protein [Candidatus Finniella inopinata]RZI45875.1 hypothetical protein EQU50_05435 [Candidatus Finniella inopinata]